MMIWIMAVACTLNTKGDGETEPDPDFFDDIFDSDDTSPGGGAVTGFFSIQSWPRDGTSSTTYTLTGTQVACTDCLYAFEATLFNDNTTFQRDFFITPIDDALGAVEFGRVYVDGTLMGYAQAFDAGGYGGSTYFTNALPYYYYGANTPPPQWSQLYRGFFYY